MAARRTSRRATKARSAPQARSRRAAARRPHRREARLAFEALSIEGGLLSPDWLARIAALEAGQQDAADYRVPKGLQLRDEIGRYWRIAQAHWSDFAAGRAGSTVSDAASDTSRALAQRFVFALLRESLGFTSLEPTEPVVLAERSYPIGFAALGGRVPVVIALAGAGLDATSPAFGDGGRRRSAFGLAQEYLNSADEATWGIASDGTALRILRDNASLTRPAWIEADLERIFTEERYADFAAFWLLAHETRFGCAGQPPTDCALEAWREAGREEGTRAREHLRGGVEEALQVLGQGFLAHPDNTALRSALETGSLTTTEYFQELLRLVYRLIFVLTVEERELLHVEGSPEAARRLYAEGYSLRLLRERSLRRSAHDRFSDLWEVVKIVFRGLATGEPLLALPALSGLFALSQAPNLDAAKLENRALLLALFRLCWMREPSGLARVNWRDMGPEELGSVYESLLELDPQVTEQGRGFHFAKGPQAKGNARKSSGSYYTPDSLVQVLLDSALEPVVASTLAAHPEAPAEALLALSVVDPACGSGHFLLAAARRIAGHVARLQTNGTPSPAEYRHAVRQVIGRCIYGVDLNALAVELCKVGLWMEAVEPGLPLTFLDSHIRHGNALLGTTPELMAKGIPDAAWTPIEGDDGKVASALKKRNKKVSERQADLFPPRVQRDAGALAAAVAELEATSDADLEALVRKEECWEGILDSEGYRHQKFVADAWCAAFVWPKLPGPLGKVAPTTDLWLQIRAGTASPPALTVKTVEELAEQYRFLHWPLAFPRVFGQGGFDVVLGNPPWNSLEVEGDAGAQLRRVTGGFQEFCSSSALYPYTGRGRKNLFGLFVERATAVVALHGRVGQVVPTELVQAADMEAFSRHLFSQRCVHSLSDFQNRRPDGSRWFPSVHPQIRFCLLTLAEAVPRVRLCFDAVSPTDLRDPGRHYEQSFEELLAFCPKSSFRVPMFFNSTDARILGSVYRGAVLEADLPGSDLDSGLMFNFGKAEKLRKRTAIEVDGSTTSFFPVLEGEYIHQYDHRFAALAGAYPARKLLDRDKIRPELLAETESWLPRAFVLARVRQLCGRVPSWFVALRRQARAKDSYIGIAALIPFAAVEGSLTVFFGRTSVLVRWLALLNSYLQNYVLARRQSGPNVNKGMYGLLPIRLSDELNHLDQTVSSWIGERVLELTYTAWDLLPFARDVGYDGPPFRWDPERRFLLRAELDAAVFHLYGLSREDTAHIMDTFPIVRKQDEKTYGEYRTKRMILEIYDAMAEAERTGVAYGTRLDPPPADPHVAHPPDSSSART